MAVTGAAWADGRAEQGAQVRRLLSQYAATAAGVVPTDQNLAVSAWVRLSSLPAGNVAAVSQSGQDNSGFWLGYSGGVKSWAFMMNHPGGTSHTIWARNPAVVPAANEWTHLTGVYDSATRKMTLYVNGTLAAGPVTYHGGAGPATAVQFGQARYQGRQTDPWPGEVDEVRVHDRALAADEIVKLVNHAATLTGHWTLDEETGTAAADAAGVTGPLTLGPGGLLDQRLARRGARARRSRRARRGVAGGGAHRRQLHRHGVGPARHAAADPTPRRWRSAGPGPAASRSATPPTGRAGPSAWLAPTRTGRR
ncbi:LamG domain-containing protein [Nonomuraea ferruginea]